MAFLNFEERKSEFGKGGSKNKDIVGRMNRKTEHFIHNYPQIAKIFSALIYHIISLCE